MRKIITVEARMGSSRLPGKVLSSLGSYSSLEFQLLRLKKVPNAHKIIVATSTDTIDDAIEYVCDSIGIDCFRGSNEDVLSRLSGVVLKYNADVIIQTTGDCPLIDPWIIENMIDEFETASLDIDMVSNCINRSFPIGLDCRIINAKTLLTVNDICKDPIHRSHGTTYIYASEDSSRFKNKNIYAIDELNMPSWRWTLDTPEDYKFLRKLFKDYGDSIIDASAIELASFLKKNMELLKINSNIVQKTIEMG
ncbi:glycosyltransferase family protein [Candidatus Pseudothioglobus singularis]|nr:glycosyltransferase family protein [Candidatus Pseudothioglobus singularis]